MWCYANYWHHIVVYVVMMLLLLILNEIWCKVMHFTLMSLRSFFMWYWFDFIAGFTLCRNRNIKTNHKQIKRRKTNLLRRWRLMYLWMRKLKKVKKKKERQTHFIWQNWIWCQNSWNAKNDELSMWMEWNGINDVDDGGGSGLGWIELICVWCVLTIFVAEFKPA